LFIRKSIFAAFLPPVDPITTAEALKHQAQTPIKQSPERDAQKRGVDDADPKRLVDGVALHGGHLQRS
jgi:hypothetical protein